MAAESLHAWRALLTSWDGWLLTFALAIAVPVLGYLRSHPLPADQDRAVLTRTKLLSYGKIVCSQWFLVTTMLLILRRHGLFGSDAGQRLANPRLTFGVTLVLLSILAIVSAIVLARLRRAKSKTPPRGMRGLRRFAPASRREMAAFAVVCLTAGFCEELLYRGWLVNLLHAATGSAWIAVVLGAIVFGVGHASQGAWAMLRTALIGVQLGALFVWVGSLIPGQVLHAGWDLLMGVAAMRAMSRLSSGGAESPVERPADTATSA